MQENLRAAGRALAIANYDFRSSGTVRKSIQIAAAARDAGLPAELWVVRAEGPFLAGVPADVPVVEVGGTLRTAGRGSDLALSIPVFARAIRRRRPALLLSGGNHLHLPARAALALSGRRGQTRLGLRASNSARRPGKDPARLSERMKYAGADFVVAVSAELAEEVRATGLRAELSCIPNGVDIPDATRRAAEPFDHPFLDGGAPVLAGIGRLARQKGFDLLIEAMALLADEPAPRLLLIGEGPDRAALEALAAARGVGDRVAFLGYQTNPFAIIARADLFVSSSRWEGSSNALLEALAVGLPLVATDCPTGNREVVERGPFGTLARTDDAPSLAAAIRGELAAHRSRADQRSGARQWALDQCLAQWVELLARHYAEAAR